MQKKPRALFGLVFVLPAILATSVFLAGSSLIQTGTIDFRVHEKDGGVSVGGQIPAALLPAAARFVPHDDCIPEEARAHLAFAEAALDELANCPDGVFVEIMSGREIVVIEKKKGRLEIFVDTPTETVEASVPLRTMASLLASI